MGISYLLRILGNTKALTLSSLGGNIMPETIYIYPNNFKDKALVTDYLDARNQILLLQFMNLMKILTFNIIQMEVLRLIFKGRRWLTRIWN